MIKIKYKIDASKPLTAEIIALYNKSPWQNTVV